LSDVGEDVVGDGRSLVDAMSGLLNVPIEFFSVTGAISPSAASTRSTSKLVVIGDESIEVLSSFLTERAYVYLSCIFLHDDDK